MESMARRLRKHLLERTSLRYKVRVWKPSKQDLRLSISRARLLRRRLFCTTPHHVLCWSNEACAIRAYPCLAPKAESVADSTFCQLKYRNSTSKVQSPSPGRLGRWVGRGEPGKVLKQEKHYTIIDTLGRKKKLTSRRASGFEKRRTRLSHHAYRLPHPARTVKLRNGSTLARVDS